MSLTDQRTPLILIWS